VSGNGCQYLSHDFQNLLKAKGITCNMGDKGNHNDNAVIESFFASLKRKHTKRSKFAIKKQARADVFDYIEPLHN
jgi:putative transposase